MALELTNENFEQEILNQKGVSLVDCHAVWCGPCQLMNPVIEVLSNEYQDKAVIGKLDVDANNETSSKYGVMSIPTLLFFKDGQVVDKHVGILSKSDLKKKLDALI